MAVEGREVHHSTAQHAPALRGLTDCCVQRLHGRLTLAAALQRWCAEAHELRTRMLSWWFWVLERVWRGVVAALVFIYCMPACVALCSVPVPASHSCIATGFFLRHAFA